MISYCLCATLLGSTDILLSFPAFACEWGLRHACTMCNTTYFKAFILFPVSPNYYPANSSTGYFLIFTLCLRRSSNSVLFLHAFQSKSSLSGNRSGAVCIIVRMESIANYSSSTSTL